MVLELSKIKSNRRKLGDPARRAFASAGLNVWASVAHATIPLALFQTVDQPGVVAGNYGSAGFAILHSLAALTLAYVQHRRGRQSDEDIEESSADVEGTEVSTAQTKT